LVGRIDGQRKARTGGGSGRRRLRKAMAGDDFGVYWVIFGG
jgi:hypothetical protein